MSRLAVLSLVVALVCATGALLLAAAAVVYAVNSEPDTVIVEQPRDRPVVSEPADQPIYYYDPFPRSGTDQRPYVPLGGHDNDWSPNDLPKFEDPGTCFDDNGLPHTCD